jgi:Tol biopolymer transport system component
MGQLDWRSPSEILLQRNDEERKRWIYSLDISTGFLQKIVQGAGFYWHYVPARKEVLYYYPNGLVDTSATELKARSLQDATDRVVAKIEHLNPYLVISADGKRIAYSTNRPIQGSNESLSDLALVTITGEQRGTLIPAQRGGGGTPIGWSPDGKYLLYSHLGPHVMNVETRESWPLHKDATGAGWGEGDWSPDGTFVVVVKRSHRRDRLSWQGVTYDAVISLMQAK